MQDPFFKPTTYTIRTKFKVNGGTATATLNQYKNEIANKTRLESLKHRDSGIMCVCVHAVFYVINYIIVI